MSATKMFGLLLIFTLMQSSISYGTVVFLHGTSCAGKTSIGLEMAARSGWKVVDEDVFYYRHLPLTCKVWFPKEFALISEVVADVNMLHAIMRNQILFKPGTDEEGQVAAREAVAVIQCALNDQSDENKKRRDVWHEDLRKEIVAEIQRLGQDSHVLVDTWLLKAEHRECIRARFPVVDVIAYCPFVYLSQRIIMRNSAALIGGQNIASMRFFQQAFKSYTGLFELSTSSEGAIDSVSKFELLHGLNIAELAMVCKESSQLFSRCEFDVSSFGAFKKSLMSQFEHQNELFVVPKIAPDLVLRTDIHTPAESVVSIVNFCE